MAYVHLRVDGQLEAKAIADFSADLARVVPMRSAEGVGVVQQVAAISDILRCDTH